MATAAKLVYTHIVQEPGYGGGKAAIDNTRVRARRDDGCEVLLQALERSSSLIGLEGRNQELHSRVGRAWVLPALSHQVPSFVRIGAEPGFAKAGGGGRWLHAATFHVR